MKKFLALFIVMVTAVFSGYSQNTNLTGQTLDYARPILTAVPFLTIPVDSRSGGMGDAGVATTPDINSQFHNPAKYVFSDKAFGASISYAPWLRQLVNDISLMYLAGFFKIDDRQVLSGGLRYFSLGNITFTDINAQTIGDYKPNEFSLSLGYSRFMTNNLSAAVVLRYINSNLTQGQMVEGIPTHPGRSVSSDVAVYYHKNFEIQKKPSIVMAGMNISNIGAKMSYSETGEKEFLPTMLKLGTGLEVELDDYNKIQGTVEFHKLLVPSPPIYDNNGNIIYGKDPNVSVPVGMFQSFYDAPGIQTDPEDPDQRSVFKEEMMEINYLIGIEYWYANQFALRGGYFHEPTLKGNRKFFTIGLGLKLNVFGIDFSYLIPTTAHHPLARTLKFTLLFNFDALKGNDKSDKESKTKTM
jgi:hypothetical protein